MQRVRVSRFLDKITSIGDKRTFKSCIQTFDAIVSMIGMCLNNHHSHLVPPCCISLETAVLHDLSAHRRWTCIKHAMFIAMIKLTFAKDMVFDTILNNRAECGIGKGRHTQIVLSARLQCTNNLTMYGFRCSRCGG